MLARTGRTLLLLHWALGPVGAASDGDTVPSPGAQDASPGTCREDCLGEFRLHAFVCLASWAVLSVAALMLSMFRQSWDAHRVEKVLRWPAELLVYKWYVVLCMVVATAMCVLHVVNAEFTEATGMWHDVQLAAQFLHITEIFVVLGYAMAKSTDDVMQLVTGRLIVDCLVAPSVLLAGFGIAPRLSFSYAASLRLLQLWPALLASWPTRSKLGLHVAEGALRLVCGSFFAGAFCRQIEHIAGSSAPPALAQDEWTMEASAYFIVSNILTLGYGDLSPKTALGQVLTTFITPAGLWLALRTVVGVAQAIMSNLIGKTQYHGNPHTRHVVVAGSPSFQVLCDFLTELLHPEHGNAFDALHVVILLLPGQQHVVDAMRVFLNQKANRRLRHCVWMIRGSALRREDLDRVKYRDASMAFLLPNLYAEDMEREDIDNIMRALSMQRYVPVVRIVTLLLKAENRDTLLSVGVASGDIVCIDELKHGVLAKSCEAQGFIVLACVLVKCTGGMKLKAREAKLNWIHDYVKGLTAEIFEVELSRAYNGAPFGEVCLDILHRSRGKAYLWALLEEPFFPGDDTVITVFPGKHARVGVREDALHKGLFVARKRADIEQFPPDTQFPWHLDAEMRASVAAGATEAMLTVPGAVPEAVAAPQHEGWIREPRDIKATRAEKVLQSTEITAAQWAAQGLRQQTKLEKESIQELTVQILNPTVRGILDQDSEKPGGPLSAEDDPEFATDPTQKALLEQQLAEQDEAAVASMAAAEGKVMFAARKVVSIADELDTKRRRAMEPLDRDKDEDTALWGCPPPVSPHILGVGCEPHPALLVRGGHVLVLALEGNQTTEAHGQAGRQTSSESARGQSYGRKLGVIHFVKYLRAGDAKRQRRPRPVVVVAASVPRDWAKVASDGDVSLVLGKISGSTLRRAGLEQAHAVVVHQRKATFSRDPNTIDADAVFACRLAESIALTAGRELLVVCDLHLERNAAFIPHRLDEVVPDPSREDEEDREKSSAESKVLPYFMQSRFASGQLFVSHIITAMAANMFYKPSLGLLMHEMLSHQFIVIPVPMDFVGRTFEKLIDHLVRKSNLLPMAVLRLRDCEDLDEEEEPDEPVPDPKQGASTGTAAAPTATLPQARAHAAAEERWHHGERPSTRFLYFAPPGDRVVSDQDGVLCVVAQSGRVVLPLPALEVPKSLKLPTSEQLHRRRAWSQQ